MSDQTENDDLSTRLLKGLDLMFEAVNDLCRKNSIVLYDIMGDEDKESLDEMVTNNLKTKDAEQ